MKKIIFFLGVLFVNAKIEEVNSSLSKIGNLALSSSQQPGPLFGFGQNIIDKNDLQFYFYSDYINAKTSKNADVMPGFLYGIKDNLSVFANIPITLLLSSDCSTKSTLPGASVQVEYAYYTKSNSTSEFQATVLSAISGPNGSMIKQVVSNRQSSTLFVGETCSYISLDWYLYASLGDLISISRKNDSELGNNFLYQFGLGKNIIYSNDYIYLFLVEILGNKFKQDLLNGEIDENSGGNILFIAPSIWFSSKKLILQFGFSIPVYQHLIGNQSNYKYQLAFNLGWTF